MVRRKSTILKGQARITVNLDPKEVARVVLDSKELRRGVEDFLLDEADFYQREAYRGATGLLASEIDVIPPVKSPDGLSLDSAIIFTSPNAVNRIAGRGPGKKPPIAPLQQWVVYRGMPIGYAWRKQKQIATDGTDRWRRQDNFLDIRSDGTLIPGGRADTIDDRLAAFLEDRFK